MGQSESDDIFVSELKAKELMVTGTWESKNVDLIIIGSLVFCIQIKISSDLLCPTILILPLPHPKEDSRHPVLIPYQSYYKIIAWLIFLHRHCGVSWGRWRPS